MSNKVTFKAGWTTSVEKQIEKCDIEEVTDKLAKLGITTDFKNNKIITWCCGQAVKIFNALNKKYKLNLFHPKAIFVEDFEKLNISNKGDRGICNWYPAQLLSSSDKVIGERTILLNSFDSEIALLPPNFHSKFKWENINKITEELYNEGKISSSHFLYFFLHEFAHSAHNGHAFRYLGPKKMLKKMRDLQNIENLRANPLEMLANDMAKKIENSLDDSLIPKYNPFQNAPYPKNIPIRLFRRNINYTEEDKLLGRIWNLMT